MNHIIIIISMEAQILNDPYLVSDLSDEHFTPSLISKLANNKKARIVLYKKLRLKDRSNEVIERILRKMPELIVKLTNDQVTDNIIKICEDVLPKVLWKLIGNDFFGKISIVYSEISCRPYGNKIYMVCDQAIQNGNFYSGIPTKIWTNTFWDKLLKYDKHVFKYVSNDLWNENVISHALTQSKTNHNLIDYIPKEYYNEEYWCIWLNMRNRERHPCKESYLLDILNEIPVNLRTAKVCMLAVTISPENLKHVPAYLRSDEMYEMVVNSGAPTIRFVPEKYFDEEKCIDIIRKNLYSIKYIKPHFITKKTISVIIDVMSVAHKFQGLLKHIPDELITEDLCYHAINFSNSNIEFVPKRFQTISLYKLIVLVESFCTKTVFETWEFTDEQFFEALEIDNLGYLYLPERLKSDELLERLIEKDIKLIKYMPKKKFKREQYIRALRENVIHYNFLSPKLRTNEMAMIAITSDPSNIRRIHVKKTTEEMWLKAIEIDINILDDIPRRYINAKLLENLDANKLKLYFNNPHGNHTAFFRLSDCFFRYGKALKIINNIVDPKFATLRKCLPFTFKNRSKLSATILFFKN